MPLDFNSTFLLILAYAILTWSMPAPCPKIHVIAARDMAEPPGFDSAGGMVNLIESAFPATSEAIDYPACEGPSECGNMTYADSVQLGTWAVATAVNRFAQRCPKTKIILVGYSQVGNSSSFSR